MIRFFEFLETSQPLGRTWYEARRILRRSLGIRNVSHELVFHSGTEKDESLLNYQSIPLIYNPSLNLQLYII